MKTESFNLNINALDDKVLYKVICRKIKESETFSFKLMWWVPLISGLIIIGFLAFGHLLSPWMVLACGLFGAGITFSIYQWDQRNIRTCQTYREYAEVLEAKKNKLEEGNTDDQPFGPFTLLSTSTDKSYVGTTIFSLTIIFWLGMTLVAFL